MAKTKLNMNNEVTIFLDALNHPFRKEIERLRTIILSANAGFTENIKWNGPNYSFGNNDRITMKIQPPKVIQLIFHHGAKKQEQPKDKLINDPAGLLTWKENDRAVATFKNMTEVENAVPHLHLLINDWIKASI